MDRLNEIQARLSAIAAELDTATGDALTALQEETDSLIEERNQINAEIQTRAAMRSSIANGAGVVIPAASHAETVAEKRAKAFEKSGFRNIRITADESRSVLVSSGTIATPTEVSGINDIPGAKYSSIIDVATIENCAGMGIDRVAYITADEAAASEQNSSGTPTEGVTVTEGEPTFAYVDITAKTVAVKSFVSKQTKKQSPLNYTAKVTEQALFALRKKVAAIATTALQTSVLNSTLNADVDATTTKGVIGATTLRDIAFAYGGNESIIGEAVLLLNKTDLIAFGDVRGTNEKKAVYAITPDAQNPNSGTIADGGLVVRYIINSNLTACAETAQTASAQPTMFYGNPRCLKIDLFSDYEINVSSDFAIDKLLDTIVGDVEVGAAVVVKNGFVAYTIPALVAG